MERHFIEKAPREIWFRSATIGSFPILWWPINLKGLGFLLLSPILSVAFLLAMWSLFPNSDFAFFGSLAAVIIGFSVILFMHMD